MHTREYLDVQGFDERAQVKVQAYKNDYSTLGRGEHLSDRVLNSYYQSYRLEDYLDDQQTRKFDDEHNARTKKIWSMNHQKGEKPMENSTKMNEVSAKMDAEDAAEIQRNKDDFRKYGNAEAEPQQAPEQQAAAPKKPLTPEQQANADQKKAEHEAFAKDFNSMLYNGHTQWGTLAEPSKLQLMNMFRHLEKTKGFRWSAFDKADKEKAANRLIGMAKEFAPENGKQISYNQYNFLMDKQKDVLGQVYDNNQLAVKTRHQNAQQKQQQEQALTKPPKQQARGMGMSM
jgi:hypothetical protein